MKKDKQFTKQTEIPSLDLEEDDFPVEKNNILNIDKTEIDYDKLNRKLSDYLLYRDLKVA